MMEVLAALAVGAGLAIVVVGLLSRARARQDEILQYLELPFAEEDVDPDELVERVGLLAPTDRCRRRRAAAARPRRPDRRQAGEGADAGPPR